MGALPGRGNLGFWSLPWLLPLFASPASAQQIRYSRVDREVVEARLTAALNSNADREKALEKSFQSAGCDGDKLALMPVKHSSLPDVICTLPGADENVIIVGAHFDHVPRGTGVVDNWSGASLLPSLFQSAVAERRRHKLVFIGFTDEEKRLVGSRFYVSQLSPEARSKVLAMINLDTLGLSSTKVWLSHADPALAGLLNGLAIRMKLPLTALDVEKVGSSDSEPFRQAKIPAMTVHSVTQQTLPILHTERDQASALRLDDYYDTYRLLAAYLAYLDVMLPLEDAGKAH
jgi:hypothetical protein